ncbi:MAG TPA: DUF1259 domain-containing protein [Dongiaceae bacterium]|jgi:hypothetical protein
MFRASIIATAIFLTFSLMTPAHAESDWAKVDQALGKQGAAQPGGVHRFGFPRSDLKVTLDGIAVKPALALGSWLAFKDVGKEAMVMGDLVLTSDEVNPVMSRLIKGGIEVTGLHNHLLRAEPATMYMHVEGHGDPVALAETLHAALALSKTPLGPSPSSATTEALDLDTKILDEVIGRKGKVSGGVYQFSVPRAEAIKDSGMDVTTSMGAAIAINFQPTGGGKAAIAGDFVLTAAEVNPVLRALRENGIEITALHNHMLADAPRLFFMHSWANNDAEMLARGLRAALDKMNLQRS